MACPCKNKKTDPVTDGMPGINPMTQCLLCAEKHLAAAAGMMFELGYEETNRFWAIAQANLAEMHTAREYRTIAEGIRDVRHDIQARVPLTREMFETAWKPINTAIIDEQNRKPRIYIISNVEYPETRKLKPKEGDLLVFLNTAKSLDYYKDFANKVVWHRAYKTDKLGEVNDRYGKAFEGVENRYVFQDPENKGVPRSEIDLMDKDYDWNYDIPEDKAITDLTKKHTKCSTTGFIVTNHYAMNNPDKEIVLVNFGFEVKKSTYRCTYHNWEYEAKALKKFHHMFTADTI